MICTNCGSFLEYDEEDELATNQSEVTFPPCTICESSWVTQWNHFLVCLSVTNFETEYKENDKKLRLFEFHPEAQRELVVEQLLKTTSCLRFRNTRVEQATSSFTFIVDVLRDFGESQLKNALIKLLQGDIFTLNHITPL